MATVTRAVYNLALVGFGNVGKTFVSLLDRKRAELGTRYNLDFLISGIASRKLGWLVNPTGFEPDQVLEGDFSGALKVDSLRSWILASRPDAVFETTSLNPQTGQPAIEHLRCALEFGAHAISANKGPVVHGYEELTTLAKQMHRKFYFESSVMDGAPVFNLFRECLPTIELRGFRGILNSTTNVILERMEQGQSFEDAVRHCQEIGVAESDPSNDIDGWDAAVKVAALATVLMGHPMKPDQVERGGIGEITAEQIAAAHTDGKRYKVVCSAKRDGERLRARVAPELLPLTDPLAQVSGTSSLISFETDVLPELAIHEINPGLDAVAFGLLTDFLRAVKES
ncbi:homoserine dehydrogenase [Candidatus Koribacter versatilis Ellin345]|uniref:Homoserine dehydrogenase n=1 Tax=Koribacter versatilis (strain Ellin345) TaxID=204669 RepID=Q1IIY5_KORVE|nr:homoserine dehydrogenase [Candidatus Koribacter versatilis]ABF43165.1 homoserine dehydrogenase [Candidatus Koribacter versatilis Ellin345]